MPAGIIANIHYCLTRVWEEKGTLEGWSDRWLVAIPKKEQDIVKVGDLRPLILVDKIRKREREREKIAVYCFTHA